MHPSNLGSYSPYIYKSGTGIAIDPSFQNAIKNLSATPSLDPVAILTILNKNYMFGDRTLIKEIRRTPWLSTKTIPTKLLEAPQHGRACTSVDQSANNLYGLLCEEIGNYIAGSKRIGILLSGGMDSRIVAGVLQKIVESGDSEADTVVAYTWGNNCSRDVVYAKRICNIFKWEHRHYTVSASDLWQNIEISSLRGCEFTGFHLHAIPQICIDDDTETILAGSYGDSVGRAEYSGIHVSKLPPIESGICNPGNLLKDQLFQHIKYDWAADIDEYRTRFKREMRHQQHELDYQIHYMRRMLNPCMELLNEKTPTFQVFTRRDVFSYIWGLDSSVRNDGLYSQLLTYLHPEIARIPWARTGLMYGVTSGVADSYKKCHHSYESHVNAFLLPRIRELILDNQMLIEPIFNIYSIEMLLNLLKKYPGNNFDYLEKILWIASLIMFLQHNRIAKTQNYISSPRDWLAGNAILPVTYNLKRGLRKLKKLI